MFCKNCGSQLDDRAVICPHCGVPTDNFRANENRQPQPVATNGFAIAGLVLGILGLGGGVYFCIVPILGLIFSIVGMVKSKKYNSGRGLATGGLVVSIIGCVIWLCVWLIIGAAMITALL